MNGFTRRLLVGLCMVGGLSSVGCWGGEHYRNLVDPCQQERYAAAARQEVIEAFRCQVENGHILDQTIWNYHFEHGSDKLHPGGMAKLDQMVQNRPQPDPRIFLATAHDLTFHADEADKYETGRRELNEKRILAIKKYLAAHTADRPVPFEVFVHDPAPTGIPAISAATSIQRQRMNYFGSLGIGAAGSGAIPGGGVGGAQGGYLQGVGTPGMGGMSGVGGLGGGVQPPPQGGAQSGVGGGNPGQGGAPQGGFNQ
jgi:hypothetical protein